MTNHAFASSKRDLSFPVLDAALKEVNVRRFNGVFVIDPGSDTWWDVQHHSFVDGTRTWPIGLSITLRTKRMIQFKKSPGDLGNWVQFVFQNELAAKFRGKCSDEGVCEKWPPEPNRAHNLKEYWDWVHREHTPPEYQPILDRVWVATLDRLGYRKRTYDRRPPRVLRNWP